MIVAPQRRDEDTTLTDKAKRDALARSKPGARRGGTWRIPRRRGPSPRPYRHAKATSA